MHSIRQGYGWAHIQRYFPKEEVGRLRKELMERRASGKYTDRQLMEEYRTSKQTFYDTIKRYSGANKPSDYVDKSKAPKHPARKLKQDHIEKIKEFVQADRKSLEN